MSTSRIKALLCVGLVLLLTGYAGAQTLPQTLNGGGPSTWQVTNSGGTNDGLPTGTSDFSPGLTVNDVTLGSGTPQDDAFDNGLTVWVNNQILAAPGDLATVTGSTLTVGPVPMSGLDVTVQYHAVTTLPVLRTLVSFSNPGASPVIATIDFVSNVGSDAGTVVSGSSSGDTTFTAADRWVVTSDSVPSNDVTNTFVLFGPGLPAVTPSAVSQVAFSDGTDTNGVRATYSITVPAGETRHLLFFNQVSDTPANALASAATFNDNPALSSALMSGITQEQADNVLNWQFGAASATGLSIVVRGTDNGIYHNQFGGTTWLGFVGVPGAMLDKPALVANGTGLDLVVRGTDNGIYHNRFDGTTWGAFSGLGGATNDVPALAANGGNLELVVRGTDNGIYHNRFDGTSWAGWTAVGGATNDAPALAMNGTMLELVVRGTDNGIYHNRFDGTSWSGFAALPGATAGTPALVVNGANLELVVRGTDNGIYHNRFDGTSWGAWTVVGGATPDDPALVAFGDGTLHLAVRGTDDGIWHNVFDGTMWIGWASVPGATPSAPSLTVDEGIVHLIVRGTDDGIWHNQLDPAGTAGWQGFVNIPGATPSPVAAAAN
jgi:hypothetical protein